MTLEQLAEILATEPKAAVEKLKATSFPKLPKWSDLEKQYDPSKHKIKDTQEYPAKLDDQQKDDFKRTSLALQKLAVSRVAQSMFATPVTRSFNTEEESDQAKKAIEIFEEIYRVRNNIDSENIERGKALNASCQIATVWKPVEISSLVEGEVSKYKLTHFTYSPMDGYTLYPILDENREMLVISIGYTGTDNVEHLMTYTNTEKPQYIHFVKEKDWIVAEDSTDVAVFPVVYALLKEPVWGGDSGTELVEELEELASYDGLYIKRNSLPTFTLDYGDTEGSFKSTTEEKSSDARRIIEVGKGGVMNDVTWEGAGAATENRYQRLRNSFFEQIQVPDTSFSNMIKSNTSAENKELIFSDAVQKALDLGGEWIRLFYNESEIVKKFLSIMFPSYSGQYEQTSIRSTINPYTIKTKKDTAEYVAIGAPAMSLETQIAQLGEVDDVTAEADRIRAERSANANQLF